jgi:hypothetical protein
MALREQAKERLQTMFDMFFTNGDQSTQTNGSWIVAIVGLIVALKVLTFF